MKDYDQRRYDRLLEERVSKSFNDMGMKLTKAEEKQLRALEKSINSADANSGREALAAAAAVATSADGKFVLGALQMELGAKLKDMAIQSGGTDLVIASGVAPAKSLPRLLRNQASFAVEAQDMVKAEAAFGKLIALQPNDADATVALAQVKNNLNKPVQAIELFDRAIALKQAANEPVPDIWVRVANQTRAQLAARTKR
jgi:tetratricopeptide (TPR) repeat protein